VRYVILATAIIFTALISNVQAQAPGQLKSRVTDFQALHGRLFPELIELTSSINENRPLEQNLEYSSSVQKDFELEIQLLTSMAHDIAASVKADWLAKNQTIFELRNILSNPINRRWLDSYHEALDRAKNNAVEIAYDDKKLTEEQNKKLALLLIDYSELTNWRKETVKAGTELKSWIAEKYNLDSEKNSEIIEIFLEATIASNSLNSTVISDESEIRFPPYPKKSEGCLSWRGVWACIVNGLRSRERTVDTNDNSAEEPPYAGVGLTRVVLPTGVTSSGIISGKNIPNNALIYSRDSGLARINLLEEDTVQNKEYNFESPFKLAATENVKKFGVENINRVANQVRLWIIDWNFQNGHGSKVRSVIDKTINGFGLDLTKYIEHVDLAPYKENVPRLNKLVVNYALSLKKSNQDEVERLKTEALAWIKDQSEKWQYSKKPGEIHEFILYAAINKVLSGVNEETDSFAVINISMEFESSAYKIFLERELWALVDTNKFILFAAAGQGSGWQPLSPFNVPQNLSALFGDIYNVAGLNCDHQSGTSSGIAPKNIASMPPPVHLVAQGCGYRFGKILPSDYGSSFASPAVAAAFWVRKLLFQRASITIDDIANASSPSYSAEVLLKSRFGGVFDPYLAVLPHQSILIKSGVIYPIRDCSVSVNINGVEKILFQKNPNSTQERRHNQVELSHIDCEKEKRCLWLRYKNTKTSWGKHIELVGQFGSYEANYVTSDGGKFLINNNLEKGSDYAKCTVN
jgi:hypothetical protein